MFGFIFMLPGIKHIKFVDELISFSFLAVAVVDCIANRNWRYYKLLWIISGILTFYLLYSLIFLKYNTTVAVVSDWIIQLKPFIPFTVMYAVRPRFTYIDKAIFKALPVIASLFIVIVLIAGHEAIHATVLHIAYTGIGLFISAMIYLYCSISDKGHVARHDLIVTIIMLTAGLGCTRSKYYGIYIIAVFFLFIFRPGAHRGLPVKYIITGTATAIGVIIVAWHKLDYYFLTGGTGVYDLSIIDSYARPVLYITGYKILLDHVPFGTGLASFGSFMSGEHYSEVYHEYGINTVYGLSEHMPDFICDTFYPSLAQFGIIGVILFIAFWLYIYSKIKYYLCIDGNTYRYHYAIGVSIIAFILIESIAATTFVQTTGMQCMLLLGMLCGEAQRIWESDPHRAQNISFSWKRLRITSWT